MSKPEFVYISYIETSAEKLWQALTDGDFHQALLVGHRVVSDWKVGSPFSLVVNGRTTDVGEILEADPPRRLSYSFRHILNEAAARERPSRVTFILEPHGKLVKLTLTHEDFAEDSVILDGISKGWPAIMSSLKSLLESSEALIIPIEALFIRELDEAYRS